MDEKTEIIYALIAAVLVVLFVIMIWYIFSREPANTTVVVGGSRPAAQRPPTRPMMVSRPVIAPRPVMVSRPVIAPRPVIAKLPFIHDVPNPTVRRSVGLPGHIRPPPGPQHVRPVEVLRGVGW